MERPNAAAAKAAGIPLKLLIDRRTKTVVFGEAGKELVDFLFSLLSLPLATIVGLLGTHSVPGSVGQLFDRIEKLDNTFFLTNSPFEKQVKEELLNPTLPLKISNVGLMNLPWNSPLSARDRMPFALGDQQRDVEGFVQGVVTYTISDDLTIAPLSTISTISLIQKIVPLRVQDLATLEERTVTVGRNEGLRILKASLHSKKVLTEVFLSKEERLKVVRVEPVDSSSSTGL